MYWYVTMQFYTHFLEEFCVGLCNDIQPTIALASPLLCHFYFFSGLKKALDRLTMQPDYIETQGTLRGHL